MTQEFKNQWGNLVEDSTHYAKLRIEQAKLKAGEQVAKSGGKLSGSLLLLTLFGVALFMFSLAAAIFIGEAIQNYSLGFLIVGGFYLMLALLAVIFKKELLERPAANVILRSIFDDEEA
jgi:hypothetical protein